MDGILETPKQLAERVGLAKTAIKRLIDDGHLNFVELGKRKRIPPGAWEDFLATRTVKACRDGTKGQSSNSYKSEAASTSCGPRTDAAASAALAQQTAQRLKSSSRASCNGGPGSTARVIPLKSS